MVKDDLLDISAVSGRKIIWIQFPSEDGAVLKIASHFEFNTVLGPKFGVQLLPVR